MNTAGPARTRVWQNEARLVPVITWIATVTALLVAIAAPTGYFLLAREAELRDAAMAARLHAAFVTQLIAASPDAWHQEVGGLLDTDLAPSDVPEQRRIVDAAQQPIATTGAPLGRLVVERAASLQGPDGAVGEVIITRSLRPTLVRTGLVALLGVALGFTIYGSLRVLPLRALRRAVAALQREESKAREEAEEQLRVVFQNAVEGIALFTPDRRITSCNPAVARMFGRPLEHLPGMFITDLLRPFSGEEQGTAFTTGQGETTAFRASGEAFPVEMSVNEARLADRPHFIAILRDITERKQAERRLSYLANYDSLTGLPNRSLFRERLERAMGRTRRNGRQLALMFLDLDRFKNINDTLGHEAGDQLLRHVANALIANLRSTDTVSRATLDESTESITVSRLGGDEFTVLVEDITSPAAAAQVATRILAAIAQPFEIHGERLYISTSIGVTLYPHEAEDLDGLVKQADMAMYRAKELGRNTYFFYNDELNTEMAERHALEASLRHALERREFHLHYQPKACLRSGRVTGVEALLRWTPSSGQRIGPDRFIPILEDIGLINQVGTWVLRTACAQIAAWKTAGLPPLRLAVNVSARQFRQPNLPEQIAGLLAEHGLAPADLEVELTESMLMEDSEQSRDILSRLGTMGIQLAIDDFGTGHSSLAYLKRFNVHALKIDRSFVKDTPEDPEDSAIATAIIGLSANLKIRVVAEGVETQAQADFLQQQGCDEMQGYLLSAPLPPREFAIWLRQRTAAGAVDPVT
ncbi:MAG TPA: EAL domain-containing protein [Rhodocyclaceae bacterium]|nr:EAL domain-containing protein [Rhodocyclaceae bacterium]